MLEYYPYQIPYPSQQPVVSGWSCPACTRINAPHVASCPCSTPFLPEIWCQSASYMDNVQVPTDTFQTITVAPEDHTHPYFNPDPYRPTPYTPPPALPAHTFGNEGRVAPRIES